MQNNHGQKYNQRMKINPSGVLSKLKKKYKQNSNDLL